LLPGQTEALLRCRQFLAQTADLLRLGILIATGRGALRRSPGIEKQHQDLIGPVAIVFAGWLRIHADDPPRARTRNRLRHGERRFPVGKRAMQLTQSRGVR
jgi:hypothetical protein